MEEVGSLPAPVLPSALLQRRPRGIDTYESPRMTVNTFTPTDGMRRVDSGASIASDGDALEEGCDPYGRGLSLRDKVRTLIWVHKQRLLGRYKWGQRYMRCCPCRPCSPGTRSFARTLSEAGPTPLLTCQLTLLGLSGYFPVRSISWDSQPGEDEIPLDASTAYLFEQFRDQPFAAAAYLRAILYCWAGGVVLLLQHATSAVLGDNSFAERVAWQWLLGQLVVQLMQLPPRLRLYRRLVDISHSTDNDEANNRIRRLFNAPFWKRSQYLSVAYYLLAMLGPFLLVSMDAASPVRREVLSICCANLLIIILRLALTFAIIHTIIEAREADNESGSPAMRGLSAESISRLRSYEFHTASSAAPCDCSICLSDFQQEDEVMHLPCDERHAFHAHCITQWLLKSSNCPLCQRAVEEPCAQ